MSVSLRKEARQAPTKTEDGSLPSVLRDIKNNRVCVIRRHREEKEWLM